MYFIGLLIMTSGENGGGSNLTSSSEGVWAQLSHVPQKSGRRHLELTGSQGTWHWAAWHPRPTPCSEELRLCTAAPQLRAHLSQLLSWGNKQAGTEEFKFCIFMSVKHRLFPPLPSGSCLPQCLAMPGQTHTGVSQTHGNLVHTEVARMWIWPHK